MASIQTAIELYDGLTAPMMNIINAVNMGVSSMYEMNEAMNNPIDTASFDAARDNIARAEIAFRELDNAIQKINGSNVEINVPSVSAPVEVPFKWQLYNNLEVFTNTGIERFEQELASVNSMLEQLNDDQFKITMASNDTDILSPDAAYDIRSVEGRVQSLIAMIRQVEETSLDVGTDDTNASLERLRGALFETINLENRLKESMQGADLSEINSAFMKLSENITHTERLVRDTFSEIEIPPVEIPITWQSDNLEVFTNTGIERFQQEIQSANNMLNILNSTQQQVATTAAQTSLFPANAVADMNTMQNRLQAIQQKIQAIESNPLNIGSDTANSELERLRGQLSQAVSQQEDLNRAVENMDIEGANQAYLHLSQTIGNTERYIRDNVDEQGNFNREIERGTAEANQLMQTIKRAVAAYASIQTAKKVIDLSDTMTQTTARLDLIVDDGGSVEELQNKIYASAQNARGSYQATADAVSKLGLMAGDAFSGTDEIVTFMEQVNKQFTIAGTEASGIDAAMLQLTQAMASGVLRGEEFNSILEQAPNIIQSIADYMGVPKGQLKDMAAEGQITSDIVKNAMFAAADETNAKFASMPMTFSQIWTSFKNTALMAFQPVLRRISEIANNEQFQNFVDSALTALSAVAEVVVEIFDLLVSVGGVIADNWSWLSPIIYGVAGALAVYYGWLLLTKGATLAASAAQAILTGAKMLAVPIYAALTGATMADTAAQWGLNSAMYACPIVWIIILIIALIALFYAVIAAINKFAGTSISATGAICGAFMVALAFIGNIFIALINYIIDRFIALRNFIAIIANFFGNVFTDPVGAIARLFFDLIDTVLSLLQTLASAIDTIFGSDLAGSVQGWRDSLTGWVDETFGKGKEIMSKVNAENYHLDRFEYKSAWDKGYEFGESIEEEISGFLDGFGNDGSDEDYLKDLEAKANKYTPDYDSLEDIAGNTSDIADAMDITEEDLKYLRDIAEKETINRFTTAEIKIEQTNNNTISSDWDLDGVVDGLTDAVDEAVNIIAEGVHV